MNNNEALAVKLTELATAISQADVWAKKADELKKSIPSLFPEVKGQTVTSVGGIAIQFGTGTSRTLDMHKMISMYPEEYAILKEKKERDAIANVKVGVSDAERVLSKAQLEDVITIIESTVTVKVKG